MPLKIMHEQLNLNGGKSVTVKWDDFEHFSFPWHFHPEYELVYVIQSFGKRFVADHVESFQAGDLVLLGSNLPHFWKNDDVFYEGNSEFRVNAIVIHFPPDFFRYSIETYPEFQPIRNLLTRAKRGISFGREVSDKLSAVLKKTLNASGLERTLLFIRALDRLAREPDYRLLASESYRQEIQDWSNDRLSKVMHLINAGYRDQITLNKVAGHIGMNPSAFSRYFKEKTSKSFSGFVNEMRVGYACKLIQEGNHNISQICYESGFNNLSNFNRQFKKTTRMTPLEYREQFHHSSVY